MPTLPDTSASTLGQGKRFAELVEDLAGDGFDVRRTHDVRQNNGEFVAAQARHAGAERDCA